MSGAPEFSTEYRCIWPDGSRHWIQVNGMVTFDAKGLPQKVNGVTQEITERKRVEAALLEAQGKITAMLDTVHVATWSVDLATNVLTADRNMTRMFFLDESQLHRSIEDYFQVIHSEDLPKVKAAMHEVLDDPEKTYKIEYRLVGPSNEIRWIDVRGTVERASDGTPVTFRGVILDITERKAAEELETRLAVSRRILAMQEQERRRIGRELHDSAGQMIAALSMDMVVHRSRVAVQRASGAANPAVPRNARAIGSGDSHHVLPAASAAA